MESELKDQIKEVLTDGLKYMKVISENYTILTDVISSGDELNVAKNYGDLREGLRWVEDALGNFEKLLDLDYSSILIGKQSSNKVIDDFKKFILECELSFSIRDYKKLTDLIENKLQKNIKKLITIFNKVKTIMKEKEN